MLSKLRNFAKIFVAFIIAMFVQILNTDSISAAPPYDVGSYASIETVQFSPECEFIAAYDVGIAGFKYSQNNNLNRETVNPAIDLGHDSLTCSNTDNENNKPTSSAERFIASAILNDRIYITTPAPQYKQRNRRFS